jgi:DNA-binding IclR family transcriptional regulator
MNDQLTAPGLGPVKSAARVLDLMELLVGHRDGLTLSEICDVQRWPKSSTLALVRTLRDRDFLADGRRERSYRLGPRVVQLSAAYLSGIDLVRDGQEVVHEVSRRCDETVHLATLVGRNVIYVAKEEGTGQVRMVSAIGKTVPAHGTGVGKMLLSALSPEEFDRLIPSDLALERLSDTTITDRNALLAELAATRERGYALDDGESTVGLRCVAAPVYDATGRMVAAMSVSVPSPRMTDERLNELRGLILNGAAELSQRLGWAGVAAQAPVSGVRAW